MEIITNGHADRYSIEQVSCLFFPNDTEIEVFSDYIKGDNPRIYTRLNYNGEIAEEVYSVSDCLSEKQLKNSIKKSMFLACKKLFNRQTPWGVLTGIRPTKFVRNLLKDNSREEVLDILTNEYWVSGEKAEFCLEVSENSLPIINSIRRNSVGLYVGIPFCPSRCSYCSFISESYALHKNLISEYVKAVNKELIYTAKLARELWLKIDSIYIGGGTPTVFEKELLESIINCIESNFDLSLCREFTVEAGRPDSINFEMLKMFNKHLVSRICINPQTMNDSTLKIIGRNHTSDDFLRAFNLARELGFNNINTDIIAGLPFETKEMFDYTLEKIEQLNPESLTVHTLYIKRASRLNKEKLHLTEPPVDDMLNSCFKYAKENEYRPYYMYKQRSTSGNLENTGYAKIGYESYYNVGIMEEVQTIFAVGAGASSKLVKGSEISRIYNNKDPKMYIDTIDDIIHKKEHILGLF
ncbi:MAG: coproporphyrinogen dehydrogenase HemZ [Bacillota bacterium]|nr:coproporphyrinogen dehydrogenase HemZ [Bacillota bacterium]